MKLDLYLRNKNIFRVDIQLYQHEWKLEKREIVWNNIAQRTLTEEWREIFRIDIELYQHAS